MTATTTGTGTATRTTDGTRGAASVTRFDPPLAAPDLILLRPDGSAQRLSDLWSTDGFTALVLLRHAGCMFCKAQARDLTQQRAALEQAGLQVVLILPETPARVTAFRAEQQVPFTLLADPDAALYRALDVGDGSLGQMVNVHTLLGGAKELLRGNRPTLRRPSHATLLPGAVLVDASGQMHWLQRAEHAADHSSSADLIAAASSMRSTVSG